MTKQPIPKIWLKCFQGGRFFRNRIVYSLVVKMPCLPSWFTHDLTSDGYSKLQHHLEDLGYVKNSFYKNDKCWLPEDLEKSDEVLISLFGKTTLQFFNRRLVSKRRIAYRNTRTLWCIPIEDCRKVLYRYRANQWNQSEKVPKEYQWLLGDIEKQFDGILTGNKEVDYSMLDIGEDRKPFLYVCNLCDREGVREDWSWSRPPGFASHDYITHCPGCKGKGGDFFDVLFSTEQSKFQPYKKRQDNYWFTV